MPYTAQFFAEKLNVAVEYFNPFRNIQIDSNISLEELAGVAHGFGEVVGLGLRNVAQCPVEMNLMPKSSLKRQQFNQKKPYFIAAVFSLVLVVFVYGMFYGSVASIKQESLNNISAKVTPLKQTEERLVVEENKMKKLQQEASQLSEWMEQRFFWADVLTELRRVMLQAEAVRKQAMGGLDNGVWIESFSSTTPGLTAVPQAEAEPEPQNQFYYNRLMMERYGLIPRGATMPSEGETSATAAGPAKTTPASTNEIAVVTVKCRGINLKRYSPDANDKLAFAVLSELQASPLFDSKETKFSGQIETVDETAITFSFGVTLKLKRPMKL